MSLKGPAEVVSARGREVEGVSESVDAAWTVVAVQTGVAVWTVAVVWVAAAFRIEDGVDPPVAVTLGEEGVEAAKAEVTDRERASRELKLKVCCYVMIYKLYKEFNFAVNSVLATLITSSTQQSHLRVPCPPQP